MSRTLGQVLELVAVSGLPIHAVWGVAKGTSEPAVLITAYRPDAEQWTPDFRRRRS